jgi:hypothetical protein
MTPGPSRAALTDELSITLLFLLLSIGALAYVYGFGLPFGAPPIRSDGFGYNAYLPAFFLDHDLTFRTMITRLSASNDPLASNGEIILWSGIVPYKDTGLYLDFYPIGCAILQMPFFLVADFIGKVFGLTRFAPTTTYPPVFQIANVASSTAYFLVGILFTFRTLWSLYDRQTVWLTVILMTFGTSLFHYATLDGSFAHVYSFALIALYIWLLFQYVQRPGASTAAAIGAVLGLITITRNQDAALGLIALGMGLQTAWQQPQHPFLRDAAIAAAFLLAAISPQLLYWHYITGQFIINSYDATPWAFQWSNPEVSNFLFSLRKGALFWGPGFIIAFVGFFFLDPRLWVCGICAFLSVAIEIYICASWPIWWFGGGFGSRPMVDYIPVLAISCAAAISAAIRWNASAVRGVVIVFTLWTTVLMHSYWIGFVCFEDTIASDLQSMPARYFALLRTGQRSGLICDRHSPAGRPLAQPR